MDIPIDDFSLFKGYSQVFFSKRAVVRSVFRVSWITMNGLVVISKVLVVILIIANVPFMDVILGYAVVGTRYLPCSFMANSVAIVPFHVLSFR